MSILENIRMGKPAASDEEVKEAARLTQCSDFIERLEKAGTLMRAMKEQNCPAGSASALSLPVRFCGMHRCLS